MSFFEMLFFKTQTQKGIGIDFGLNSVRERKSQHNKRPVSDLWLLCNPRENKFPGKSETSLEKNLKLSLQV